MNSRRELLALTKSGYVRARIDGVLQSLDDPIHLDKKGTMIDQSSQSTGLLI